MVEALVEELSGRCVSRTLEQHVPDGLEGAGCGRVGDGRAGWMGAVGVDGVGAGLVEPRLDLARASTVEEETGTASGLRGGVVEEVEGDAG